MMKLPINSETCCITDGSTVRKRNKPLHILIYDSKREENILMKGVNKFSIVTFQL